MAVLSGQASADVEAAGRIGRIPVRNLWLLMLYASDLFRIRGSGKAGLEDNQDDIPDLVAEILAHAAEKRMRRNLSFGYRHTEDVLSRVRGRIDLLATERHRLLARGLVACRFEELTVDTPRNRYVCAALQAIARVVRRPELAHRCRSIATSLKRLGVSEVAPTRVDLSRDRFGHHDLADRFMVAAAKLAFDLALPTEAAETEVLGMPDREAAWVRRLYERAVGGFYRIVLEPEGWRVDTGRTLNWQVSQKTPGIDMILPSMRTDIVLEHGASGRRIVIDTKFTTILTAGWYRDETLRSGYLYQIYAYLRSQVEAGDPLAPQAAGMLLHPAVGGEVDETVVIQGHPIRFATVNLAASARDFRSRLLELVEFPVWPEETINSVEDPS